MIASAPVKFDDLLAAYDWVSSSPDECEAFVSRLTGKVHCSSSAVDLDEDLPEDIEDASIYVAVPDRHELNLGRHLALTFAEDRLADAYQTVANLFRRRGAYRRFKDLLERKGCLQAWYDYEAEATALALRQWAEEQGLAIIAGPGTMTIRRETPADEAAIEQVTRRAFLSHPYSQQTEQFIIRALRADHALSVSLVAEEAGRIVGHIALSPVTISDGATRWYGLGPISVEPERQGQGIGRALMESGLAELDALGANGCVLVGDPAFYTRFGFASNPALVLEGVPPEFFLARSFGGATAQGHVQFHPAFQASGA